MPRCRECKEKFVPRKFLQKYCMEKDVCITAFLASVKKTNEKKIKAETNKRLGVIRASLMTHKDWMGLLQKVFNTWIRMRDAHLPCISCGTTANVEYAAGHFYPTTYGILRFHEDNVHKQCNKHCNMMLRGNLHPYRIALEKKIGADRLAWLDAHAHDEVKLSVADIQDKIADYKLRIKTIKNKEHEKQNN